MAELTPITGVTLTGVPVFADPFTADLLPFYGGAGQSLNELAQTNEAAYPGATADEALAPPVPVLLPEVIVTPPPRVAPVPVPVPGVSVVSAIARGLTGLGALLFSTPTAPPRLDEAPTPPGVPPPPDIPVTFEDFQPPNWWELIEEPYQPYPKPRNLGEEFDRLLRNLGRNLDELTRPAYPEPTLLPEVVVEPRPVTTRSTPGLMPGTPVDFWFLPDFNLPAGTPYDFPDIGVSPDTGPGSAPAPERTPGIDPIPGNPFLDPFPVPDIRVAPDPFRAPAPDVSGFPRADPIGDPIGDSFLTPGEPATPGRVPRTPAGPTDPILFADPVGTPLPDPFLTEFQPQPFRPNVDQCECDKPKKEKKKRSLRTKCFKGTYVQRTQGITFIPKEEVPCEKKARVSKRETDPFGRPVPRKRGTRKKDNWKDIIDQVFPKP